MSSKSTKSKLQELLYSQMENITTTQSLLQIMQAQKKLLFRLNKKAGNDIKALKPKNTGQQAAQ